MRESVELIQRALSSVNSYIEDREAKIGDCQEVLDGHKSELGELISRKDELVKDLIKLGGKIEVKGSDKEEE